ncbi:hypothetical protein K443DRAFT_491350 [Laccaria amethystina LaAM-08-1]|uniref:Uncharacterized protein n=1 Tax=Laccaria amethystina LaAM-08-1 TaxID=1095629 RepID=A0A0C9XZC6_9AGAR|nr:hypothetical protein K443DRAFT_491350 [Laccaria amethystina LaAM-08-1]
MITDILIGYSAGVAVSRMSKQQSFRYRKNRDTMMSCVIVAVLGFQFLIASPSRANLSHVRVRKGIARAPCVTCRSIFCTVYIMLTYGRVAKYPSPTPDDQLSDDLLTG